LSCVKSLHGNPNPPTSPSYPKVPVCAWGNHFLEREKKAGRGEREGKKWKKGEKKIKMPEAVKTRNKNNTLPLPLLGALPFSHPLTLSILIVFCF